MLLDYILVGTSLLAVTSGLHNDGITAMHRTRTGLRDFVFAGSKSGGIYYRVENRTDTGNRIWNEILRSPSNDDNTEKNASRRTKNDRYPIYSITTTTTNRNNNEKDMTMLLFCGSADRFISVWKLRLNNATTQLATTIPSSTSSNINTLVPTSFSFEFVQKLGPHTGWVKGLVYDSTNRVLHSLGCNCIESWDCSPLFLVHTNIIIKTNSSNTSNDDEQENNIVQHIAKRKIESSLTLGVTLSSDLLCLCLLPSSYQQHESLTISGGVDGRLHAFYSNPTGIHQQPLHSTTAHNGRVNSIQYSAAMRALLTIGNDGMLCVFTASIDQGFELQSKLDIGKEYENPNDTSKKKKATAMRLTAATIIEEDLNERKCVIAIGSSNGELFLVTVRNNNCNGDNSEDSFNHNNVIICQLDCGDDDKGAYCCNYYSSNNRILQNKAMIYSLTCEEEEAHGHRRVLWIGHANGLDYQLLW